MYIYIYTVYSTTMKGPDMFVSIPQYGTAVHQVTVELTYCPIP